MKHQEPPIFEELPLPRRELPKFMGTHYRVYSDDTNFVAVKASNALEALKASGLENACRIQRDTILLHRIVELDSMSIINEGMVCTTEHSTESRKPELPELGQPEEPRKTEPLVTNDVEKLLQPDPNPAS